MTLKVLQEQGNRLREPYSKHLEDGIFEVRGKVGSDISRVLYFFYYGGWRAHHPDQRLYQKDAENAPQ